MARPGGPLLRAVRQVIRTEVRGPALRTGYRTNQNNATPYQGAVPISDAGQEFFIIGVSSLDDGETWNLP